MPFGWEHVQQPRCAETASQGQERRAAESKMSNSWSLRHDKTSRGRGYRSSISHRAQHAGHSIQSKTNSKKTRDPQHLARRPGNVTHLLFPSITFLPSHHINAPIALPAKYSPQQHSAQHSQQSAQHSHPSSHTKQQHSVARHALKHPPPPPELCFLWWCWGGGADWYCCWGGPC